MTLHPPAQRTVPGLLAWRASERPNKTFLTFIDRELRTAGRFSYADVERNAACVAAHLQRAGIKKGDAVAVHLPNVPEFLFCWMGIARIGAFMVATNLKSAPDEMAYYLTHSEAKALLSHTEFMGAVEPILPQCPAVREIALLGDRSQMKERTPLAEVVTEGAANYVPPPIDPLDTCAVLYTSGTTSRPKGVMITHANYIWAAEVMARTTALRESDKHLVCAPYFHINAQTYSTLPALAAGAEIILMERFTKSRFWDVASEHEPTVASLVTSMIRMLLAAPEHPYERNHRFRLWGCGAKTGAAEQRFGVRTIGWFGMTETVTVPIATSLQDAGKSGAIGTVNFGYAARIVRDGGTACAPGETGELLIHGVPGISLMKGYLKNPQATAETISEDGWLRTGDNVVADEAGYITYVNRGKDMLKVGGENVAAGEIERVLQEHPAVYEAAVIGVSDDILQEVPKAFVLLREGKQTCEAELLSWCATRLAKFKVPRQIEFRDELPRSTLDKVAKKVLREQEQAK